MFDWTLSDDVEQEQEYTLLASEREVEMKTAFAEALLRNEKSTFEIALELAGRDNFALVDEMCKLWPNDKFVKAERQRLIDEFGHDYFLPTAYDFAADVWVRMRATKDAAEYAELAELYAKTRGFIKKPDNVINNNTQVNIQHVMEVPPTVANVDDWALTAGKQQKQLIGQSAKHVN
jgi:hypothetical protein